MSLNQSLESHVLIDPRRCSVSVDHLRVDDVHAVGPIHVRRDVERVTTSFYSARPTGPDHPRPGSLGDPSAIFTDGQ
jgi:hypothetical protein